MPEAEQNIANAIVSHLKELLDGSELVQVLTTDTDLIASGLLDSLNIVRLIQFVEAQYGLYIDDDDIGPELFTSANALASYVQSKS